MRASGRLAFFVALITLGVLARGLVLKLPGTSDLRIFRTWTHVAATEGPTQVYGTGSGLPMWHQLTHDRLASASDVDRLPAWRWLELEGHVSRVDYPPGAIYALAAVGWLHGLISPTRLSGIRIAIKLLAVFAGVGLALVIANAVAVGGGTDAVRWTAVAFWCNPAVILHGAALGYVDAVYALPAIGAVFAASRRWPLAAGMLVAVSCLIKPQGVLVLPAVAYGVWQTGGWRASGLAATGGAATVWVFIWPIVDAGAFGSMVTALAHLVTDGFLSGNALNLWWLATFVAQSAGHLGSVPWETALVQPVHAVSIAAFLSAVGASPSVGKFFALGAVSWAAVATTVAWALWRAGRDTSLLRLSALAALTVHAYFVFALQVHENHLFLAIPLLAIVAGMEAPYRALFAAITAIAALNLNLMYGFGDGVGYGVPRTLTGIDLTVIVALMNIATFVWHVVVFGRLRGGRPNAGSSFSELSLSS